MLIQAVLSDAAGPREGPVRAALLGGVRAPDRHQGPGHRHAVHTRPAGRPVVYVSNHSSWVDVPVVGGVLDGCFVAKGDVGDLAGHRHDRAPGADGVRVAEAATSTGKERDAMRAVLSAGDNLILFPEGTSSDGSRVLPFRTSFFAVAEARARRGSGADCR